VPSSFGAPTAPLVPLRDTAYFKYIYENHQGHHVLGGQCNYNVCCPMTDHLLGTYVEPHVWCAHAPPSPTWLGLGLGFWLGWGWGWGWGWDQA
jgi:hypothetical protein